MHDREQLKGHSQVTTIGRLQNSDKFQHSLTALPLFTVSSHYQLVQSSDNKTILSGLLKQ